MSRPDAALWPYTPQPFQRGRRRGLGHPQLVGFLQDLSPLGQLQDGPDVRVYRERPNLVCEVRLPSNSGLPGVLLIVKSFGWRGPQHYLLSPFKRSQAMRAYRVACHLLAHGLRTPLPLGVLEERRWGFVQYNVYATEALTNFMTLKQYRAVLPEGAAGLEEVMHLVADYIRRMHDSGLWHRDITTSNVLLIGPPGNRQVYLVDLNRARRLPCMPAWLRAIDLARLGWGKWQPQFCALYSSGRFATARLLWVIRLYSRWRTWRWHVRRVLRKISRSPAPGCVWKKGLRRSPGSHAAPPQAAGRAPEQ